MLVRLGAYKTKGDWILIGHHTGILTVLGMCLHHGIFHQLNCLMLVAEPNSIFLHLHALINRTRAEGSSAHLWVLRCFWATWYVCRWVVMLTVIPSIVLYNLYIGSYSADPVQLLLAWLALFSLAAIGIGHPQLHVSMSKAQVRALDIHSCQIIAQNSEKQRKDVKSRKEALHSSRVWGVLFVC